MVHHHQIPGLTRSPSSICPQLAPFSSARPVLSHTSMTLPLVAFPILSQLCPWFLPGLSPPPRPFPCSFPDSFPYAKHQLSPGPAHDLLPRHPAYCEDQHRWDPHTLSGLFYPHPPQHTQRPERPIVRIGAIDGPTIPARRAAGQDFT